MPSLPRNILGAEAATKAVSPAPLRSFAYTSRSSGTKDLSLKEEVLDRTGYWAKPSGVSSKPPRWIVHIDATREVPVARLAQDSLGGTPPAATPPGYINNGSVKCALATFRLMSAVRLGPACYKFPDAREWIVQFAFAKGCQPARQAMS